MFAGDAAPGKLAANIVGFGRALRRAGLPVDSARIRLAQQAAQVAGIGRRDDLFAALQTVLVSRQEDRAVFADLFAAFFRDPELARQLLHQLLPKTPDAAPPPPRSARAQEALLALAKRPETKPAGEATLEFDAALSASDMQRLRHADFASLSGSEFRLIEQLLRQIPLAVPRIASRRYRAGGAGSRPHWGRLLRESARFDGEFGVLPRERPCLKPLPLLVLVDVSGSMERYARVLLAFLHRATRGGPRAAFAFGVGLSDLRRAFREPDTDRMLEQCNRLIPDFAGGTRLGESLAALRSRHPEALIGRRSMVLLVSDGLDTGDTATLERGIGWLRRQSRHLVWLNPLLRYAAYTPSAAGARVLARHADSTLAVHDLWHLERVAESLARLVRAPAPRIKNTG